MISLIGRLDASTAAEAETQILAACATSERMLLELSELEYISSAGLRVLLITAKTMQHKAGKLALCNMSPPVKEIFNISGFNSIFKIFPTAEESTSFLLA